jgi:hypothetical protein
MLSIKELFTFFSLYSIEFTLGVRKDQIVVSRQSTSVPSVGDAPRNCLDLRHRASNTGSTSDVIVIVYPARAVSSNRADSQAVLRMSRSMRSLSVDFIAPMNSLKAGRRVPGMMVCSPLGPIPILAVMIR